MKKIIYSLMALVVAFAFTACDDDLDMGTAMPSNPAAEIVGTYTGDWHQVLTNSSGEVQGEKDGVGSIEISAVEGRTDQVVVTIKTVNGIIAKELSDIANCGAHMVEGNAYYYVFNTDKAVNIGSFSAKLEDGRMSLSFSSSVTVNRKRYTSTNTFSGVPAGGE
ncbi:MAG: hypothetical protein NC344_05250 [Bacteroidales bacterium]|nr:hypothetical protein [Bacteroidales bacterium]MCM1147229.1 hypothetical protein [Bacteroidales bacterium]MCM1207236.1 hypothetical protein [Bacillota bacterium]MCM1509741.1 hypothetical protein [Clostridium sp.]